MPFALFIVAETEGTAVGDATVERVAAALLGFRGLLQAILYRPIAEAPETPFSADGSGPTLVIELRFAALTLLEAALQPGQLGRLDGLLQGARFEQQAFAARDFAVPEPMFVSLEPCTFLVQYPGPAADQAAWLDYYDAHHPAIMVRFPDVRMVSTYRPVPSSSGLDWERGRVMQRNKVAFDSAAALAAALASPVMAAMRADRDGFPPFEGGAKHYPMRTRFVG